VDGRNKSGHDEDGIIPDEQSERRGSMALSVQMDSLPLRYASFQE
jgi:hypothetical protein